MKSREENGKTTMNHQPDFPPECWKVVFMLLKLFNHWNTQ